MAGFKLTAFGGYVPRVSPTLLQDNEAVKAVNSKLYSGSLRPWLKPGPLEPAVTVPAETKTIYKVVDSDNADQWFAWGSEVDVVKGPLSDSEAFRIYYTGDGAPKKTNDTLAGTAQGTEPDGYLSMGVPAPVAAPVVTRVGSGSSGAEARVYAITHISQFGGITEESAPSAASATVTVYTGDSVTVSNLTQSGTYSRSGTTITITETSHGLTTGNVVKLDFTSGTATDGVYTVTVVNTSTYTVTDTASGSTSGNVTILYKAPPGTYNLTHRRIYRSVTGSGATAFQFVAEVPITTTSYSDTKTAAQLGETLATTTWEMPPSDLKGLVEMPNGILAGFSGKDVYFCVPYYPHAWPVEYMISVENDVVGLGVFGQSLAVLTKGNPYLVSGITSEAMSSEKIAMVEPCVSKRTIVSDSNGVTYASPNGLVEMGPAGAQVITKNVMLKEEFQEYNPYDALSASTQGRYFMFYSGGSYEIDTGCIIFDRNLPNTPLTASTIISTAAFVDVKTGTLYIVQNDEIHKWEGDEYNSLPFEWKSKEFILNYPVNLGAIEVLADYDDIATAEALQASIDAIIAQNQALFAANSDLQGALNSVPLNTYQVNGSILGTVPPAVEDRFILIIIYAEGVEVQRLYITQRGVYKLVSGYKSDKFQFTANGNVPLRHIKIAETAKELKAL